MIQTDTEKINQINILIVEDNAFFRQSFKEHLHLTGPNVQEAVDGPETLEKVKTFPPHLIFMDIRLPGESGLSLTKKIKARHPEIQIVIVTSYDNPEYREAARQSGASHFFSKDALNFEEITALINAVSPR
ncbi:MAG: response regulator [Deltaproteobacteria bacterium]|nr:response regulator [Deltaproteobacteria bacterium]